MMQKKFTSVALSFVLSCALMFTCVPFALADNVDPEVDGRSPRALPSEFYLTNLGYVTPAKLQSPWGTCWAFAVASAVESSILKASAELANLGSDADEAAEAKGSSSDTYDATSSADDVANGSVDPGLGHPMAAIRGGSVSATSTDDGVQVPDPVGSSTATVEVSMDSPDLSNLSDAVDVSERAIGWFAHEPQSEDSTTSQIGEGYVRRSVDPLTQFEGGNFSIVTAMLVARQALIPEDSAPYRYNGYDGSDVAWFSNSGSNGSDARHKDWSLPGDLRASEDLGWYVSGVLELASPAILDTDPLTGMSVYEGYDARATEQIKEALVDVGAVAVCLNSELSLPSELSTNSIGRDTLGESIDYSTWSQYSAADSFVLNHAVTIVGWDDSYPIEAFRNKAGATPPSPGAWLCKNNWGSSRIVQENGAAEGLVNWGLSESGSSSGDDATGFFWLSYYDHTISTPVAFEVSPNDGTNLYQYDNLGASEFFKPTTYTSDVLVANVFTANETEVLGSIGGWTFDEDETIHTYVYALPSTAPHSIEGEQFLEALGSAELLSENSNTFGIAGYHEIGLEEPVMLYKGERFVVIQQIDTIATNLSGEKEPASYLSLEVAFMDPPDLENVSSRANVISNEGETFVSVYGPQDWRSVGEYNDWYADLKSQTSQSVDMVFGNALIKAITKSSSMAAEDRVYEHVRLEPVVHEG